MSQSAVTVPPADTPGFPGPPNGAVVYAREAARTSLPSASSRDATASSSRPRCSTATGRESRGSASSSPCAASAAWELPAAPAAIARRFRSRGVRRRSRSPSPGGATRPLACRAPGGLAATGRQLRSSRARVASGGRFARSHTSSSSPPIPPSGDEHLAGRRTRPSRVQHPRQWGRDRDRRASLGPLDAGRTLDRVAANCRAHAAGPLLGRRLGRARPRHRDGLRPRRLARLVLRSRDARPGSRRRSRNGRDTRSNCECSRRRTSCTTSTGRSTARPRSCRRAEAI